jgi:ATP-dependent protease Clp ATPase subunit
LWKKVKAFMDRFVVAQDAAKKALAVALCDHYNHARRCLADSNAHARSPSALNLARFHIYLATLRLFDSPPPFFPGLTLGTT